MKKEVPGGKALDFKPSEVSWATSRYIDKRVGFAKKIFIHSLSTTIIILLTYSYFTKVANTIEARGKLVSNEDVVEIKSAHSFEAAKVFVRNDSEVKKGDLLALSADAIDRETINQVNQDVAKLQAVLVRLETDVSCCLDEIQSYSTIFSQIKSSKVYSQLSQIIIHKEELISTVTNLQNFTANNRDLISIVKENKAKISKIKRSRSRRLLKVELEKLQRELEQAQGQLNQKREQLKNSFDTNLARLSVGLEGVATKLIDFNNANSLKASADGIVSDNLLQEGGLIQTGVKVMSLIPLEYSLIGEIYILNKDIGEVKKGQRVKLSVDAYPEREYGPVYAEITSLSRQSKKMEQLGEIYTAKLKLEKQTVQKNEKNYPLKLSMTMQGNIIKKRERLLYKGIRKMLNLKDDVFGN